MKQRDDGEIINLINVARSRELDITFIIKMPLGEISSHSRKESFCSSDNVQATIKQLFALLSNPETTGGPVHYFRMAGS